MLWRLIRQEMRARSIHRGMRRRLIRREMRARSIHRGMRRRLIRREMRARSIHREMQTPSIRREMTRQLIPPATEVKGNSNYTRRSLMVCAACSYFTEGSSFLQFQDRRRVSNEINATKSAEPMIDQMIGK